MLHIATEESCGDRFNAAAAALKNLAGTPESVQKILQWWIDTIIGLKTCFEQGDLDCLRDALNNVGIPGTKQAIAETEGTLKALFENMFVYDQKAAEEMNALTPGEGAKASQILCDLLNTKTDVANKYLKEHS